MNLLHTGYDLSKIKKIEYVPSKLFQNQFNDKNLLQCNILKIKTENVFSGFNLDNKVNLNISHNDMFKTTNMISKIEKKETDLLKGIDEKGSQSLSKMLGVESKMNIHTYNPEILIQKLKGVSEQLKNFKYKKNSSEEELKSILEECSLLVEIGSIDVFVIDSIISAIELGENFSKFTDYDISGLSGLLKQNKDFAKLCKILSIKYSVFNNVPPELQMVLIISCTTLLCLDKNSKSKNIESYLNETV